MALHLLGKDPESRSGGSPAVQFFLEVKSDEAPNV